MTDAIVRVTNVSKKYLIGTRREAYGTLRDSITNAVSAPLKRLSRNGSSKRDFIWALKDVNFQIAPSEILGIIGHNGAGKSTLLKILSRIVEPTQGRVELFGRVGSLLEVGTAFHPELSGRENIFLNGAVLGMRRTEIARKFDEIVSFAEVDRFLDTPVKHYSSGMYMRLAFAVAAHLEPEILLVDEVLAVGDASFQKKCLGKMGEIATGGRTIVFVSHNMAAIQALCKRVLWISTGQIEQEGEAVAVVSQYLKTGSTSATETIWNTPSEAPGNDRIRVRRTCVRRNDPAATKDITIETPFVLEFEYWNFEPDLQLSFSLHVRNQQGDLVFATVPLRESAWYGKSFPVGLFRSICYVPGGLLNDGTHRVLLLAVKDEEEVIFSLEDAVVFDVLDSSERRGNWHGKWPGVVRPDLRWDTEYLESGITSPQEDTGRGFNGFDS